jgi:hypothetical protein
MIKDLGTTAPAVVSCLTWYRLTPVEMIVAWIWRSAFRLSIVSATPHLSGDHVAQCHLTTTLSIWNFLQTFKVPCQLPLSWAPFRVCIALSHFSKALVLSWTGISSWILAIVVGSVTTPSTLTSWANLRPPSELHLQQVGQEWWYTWV